MDVDGGSINPEQPDLEQSLLQEFSRMGTTDKEELIIQMQKLLGPTLNKNTASFFLDMNNWNLQEATCCYLDFQPTIVAGPALSPPAPLPLPPPPPSCQMELVGNPKMLIPHPPGIDLPWGWVVRNSGTENWPEGCSVRPVDSSNSIANVPTAVQPKKVFVIQATLTTPSSPGAHSQVYRLFTPQGIPFGDELWVNLIVQDDAQSMQCMDQPPDENMC